MKTTFFACILLTACSIFARPVLAIHDEVGKVRCLACHVKLPLKPNKLSFHEGTDKLCKMCHEKGHFAPDNSHPINMVPSMAIPKDMYRDHKGKLTCITCHTYHAGWKKEISHNPKLLRRHQGKTFCFYCHNKI
jgi:predicted CXXCH cytochrome family protein